MSSGIKVKLSDAFDLQMGKTPSRSVSSYWEGEHSWVSISDLSDSGKYIAKTKECITDEAIKDSKIKIVPKGTVIMSFKLSIGKTAITASDIFTNEAIMAFHDKGKYIIDPEYMYYFCCGNNWLKGTNKAVMGLTLNKNTLSNYLINIPSLLDQKKIISKLNQISEVIENRQRTLTLLDELVKSRFVEMFGDPIINDMDWNLEPLKELTNKIGSGATPKGGKQSYQEEGISLIRSMNVHDGKFLYKDLAHINDEQADALKNVIVQSGDVLFNITGASVTRCAIVPNDVLPARVNQHVCIIRCKTDRINPVYSNFAGENSQRPLKIKAL